MKRVILILAIYVFIFPLISAIEDDVPIQIQTTDLDGNIITGTFEITINISNSSGCEPENVLYSNTSTRATDNRGIIAFKLENVSLAFNEQYWFCYYRDGTLKQTHRPGRIPFAFNSKFLNGYNASFFWPLNNTIFQNVGIGIESPGKLLHLKGSNPTLRMTDTASLVNWDIIAKNTDRFTFTNDAGAVLKYVFENGNVGINTATPSEKLDVNGSLIVSGGLLKSQQHKIFVQPGTGYFDGSTVNVGNTAINRFADATSTIWAVSVQVPSGATGISSMRIYYKGYSSGDLAFNFGTEIFPNTSGGSSSSDTDIDTQGGQASGTGIVTVPGSAYNALTVTEGDLLSLEITRAGGEVTDTYNTNWDVIGVEFIFS